LAVLPHPPYSPDLAPSDCHIFGALKDGFHLKRFRNVDEVIEAVAASTGIKMIQIGERCSFFLTGARLLEVDGNYEKKK
jgi:hypothetical protein